MSAVTTPGNASHATHHRLSREEMEALARNFVGNEAEAGAPGRSRIMLAGGIAAAVVLASATVFFAGRSGADNARQESAAASRAAAEVEELRQRLEAERERTRKELGGGTAYLERIAAADAALVRDLSASAERLASRGAAAPVAQPSASDMPTPREESSRAATVAPAATVPTVTAAPAGLEEQAPAQAEPVVVAQAPKPHCQIHVSELSDSGTLTYEAVRKMKGARVDEASGHVFTPPVPAAGGRKVVFEVMPTGCVRVARR